MKLLRLEATRYRSLREESVEFSGLDVLIGANASGKSAVLDALRFLHEGVQTGGFRSPVYTRGGIVHLGWKGEEAHEIKLVVRLGNGETTYVWTVTLVRQGFEFRVEEEVERESPQAPPAQLLRSENGEGWWWSGDAGRVTLKQDPMSCALASAAADVTFPARLAAEYVGRWGFFDPSPFLLRRDWVGLESSRLDQHGRNLAETLQRLKSSTPETFKRIVEATRSIVGQPLDIEMRESEDRFYFVQREEGLQFPVNQMGASSGTLRMLALMTALLGEPEANLIGIEEPENYVHPTALASFVEQLVRSRDRVQFIVTTHSPLLLDYLDDPAAISVVRRNGQEGTKVDKQDVAQGVRAALDASGFGLGEYYQTKGFGS